MISSPTLDVARVMRRARQQLGNDLATGPTFSILALIAASRKPPTIVEIADGLGISAGATSRWVAILRERGLVTTTSEGGITLSDAGAEQVAWIVHRD